VTQTVRLFLFLEASSFAAAALIHAGVLTGGYEHWQAATAESVIATVLVVALAATAIVPQSSRAIGIGSQAFALVGTMVGMLMIAIGVGPQTALDLVIHAGFIALLISGLIVVVRSRIAV
jgi:hypothetical protein